MVCWVSGQANTDITRPADGSRFGAVGSRVGTIECVADGTVLVGRHGNIDILIACVRNAGLRREGRCEHGRFAFADRFGAQCRDGGMTDGIRPDSSAGNGVYVVVIVIRYGLHIQYIGQRLAAQLGGHTVGFHYAVTGPERIVVIIVNAALGAVVLHTGDLAVGSCYAHTDLIRAAGHTAVRYCADVGARAGGQTGDFYELHDCLGDRREEAVLFGNGFYGNVVVGVPGRLDGQGRAVEFFRSAPGYARVRAVRGVVHRAGVPGRNRKFRRRVRCIQKLSPRVRRFQGRRGGSLLAFLFRESVLNCLLYGSRRIGCTGYGIHLINSIGIRCSNIFECIIELICQ